MKAARTIFRWLLAVVTAVICVRQFAAVLKTESLFAVVPLLFGFAALIATILLIAPETVFRIAGFVGSFFSGIIYPEDRAARPVLSYRLAHRYAGQLRYGEALAEYQKILHYYPRERNAYLELLAIARGVDDERTFRKYTKKFQKQFRCDPPMAWAAPPRPLPDGQEAGE